MIFPIFSYTFQIEAETCVSASKSFMRFFMSNSIGLYIHIPFCKHKCPYCDFFSGNADENAFDNYVIELKDKIKYWSEKAKRDVATVYFGGGTPTTLSAEQLDTVLGTVNNSFDMSTCREFTVEAGRPDTIDIAKLFALKENKVDRISINPQTVNDEVLKTIGRKHTAQQFFDAFELARKCGFDNINTDLIAGLPTDTPESFKNSLDKLLPKKLIPVIVELSKIEPDKKIHDITKQERMTLVKLIKNLTLTLTGLRGFNEAIITQGGVSVKQINPTTMESKLVKNVYFVGEVIDVDAVTGGFNLQIAWSTAYAAGTHLN